MPAALDIDILHFKDPSIVFTDTLCFNFTLAYSNKNNNNNNDNNNNNNNKKKKMEKFGLFTKCQKLLKQLCTVSAIVRTTKQHFKDFLKSFLTEVKKS